MKKRYGFVSNSSSSSFLLIETEQNVLIEAGTGDGEEFESERYTCSINDMIKMLESEQRNGAKNITFEFGGGYDQ